MTEFNPPTPTTAPTGAPPLNPSRALPPPIARLSRPREGRVLGGVCAGLAERYGWDRRTVRIVAVVSVLLPGPQVLAYIAAWILLPDAADGRRIVDLDKVDHDLRDVVGA